MTVFLQSRLIGAAAAAVLIFSITVSTQAAPMPPVQSSIGALPSVIVDVRARKIHHRRIIHHRRYVHRRRHSGVPAAFLGLFGAVLGAGIASERYDNYSYEAYGQPYYGYSYNQQPYAYQQPYYGGFRGNRGHHFGGRPGGFVGGPGYAGHGGRFRGTSPAGRPSGGKPQVPHGN